MAILAVSSLTRNATAQEAKSAAKDATYVWKIEHYKGEIVRVRERVRIGMKLPMDLGELTILGKSVLKETCKSVAENGDATLEEKTETHEVHVKGTGQAEELANAKSSELDTIVDTDSIDVISKNGMLLKSTSNKPSSDSNDNSSPLDHMDLVFASFPTPGKSVKIGDTWTTEMINPVVAGKKITLTSTLLGIEKLAGVDTLKIQLKIDVPTKEFANDSEIIKVDKVYYIEPMTGSLMRSIAHVTNIQLGVPGAGSMLMEAHMITTRIVPTVNDKEESEEEKTILEK